MRKSIFVFRKFCIPIVNLGYLAKHSIMHPNLIYRNIKIAQTQGFFEEAGEREGPMRDVINGVIRPHKYL